MRNIVPPLHDINCIYHLLDDIIMWFSIVALVGCVAAAIYLGIQYRDSCKRIKQMEEARKIYAKRYGLSKSDE
jgi:hypothetical protein